ncbi:hypothetical protein [Raineyella sp.]|uniref:hypothetical protein n=1 Tax=Raineyella sp. TaxID=1911550 RepID=UPI002B1FB1BE|nr:hypothetical protein [Raineyella sp.]MEA5154686.1 hypothetical protein [Raineyella sp.]
MTSPLSSLAVRWRGAPGTLCAAAVLLVLQTVGFAGFGLFEFGQLQAGRVMTGVITAVLLVAWGLVLLLGAYALLAGRVFARGPVLAAELIQIPTAWSFRGGQTTWVALALGISSLLVIVLVLLPASTRHLVGPRPAQP